jgi:hypothetical protein
MQNEINSLHTQCTKLVEAKRQELEIATNKVKDIKAELLALEKIQKSFSLFGSPSDEPVRRTRSVRNGQPTKVARVLEILKSSDKALDTGSIAKALGDEDNARTRTQISGILGKFCQGPDSPIVRVSPGIYAARG